MNRIIAVVLCVATLASFPAFAGGNHGYPPRGPAMVAPQHHHGHPQSMHGRDWAAVGLAALFGGVVVVNSYPQHYPVMVSPPAVAYSTPYAYTTPIQAPVYGANENRYPCNMYREWAARNACQSTINQQISRELQERAYWESGRQGVYYAYPR